MVFFKALKHIKGVSTVRLRKMSSERRQVVLFQDQVLDLRSLLQLGKQLGAGLGIPPFSV